LPVPEGARLFHVAALKNLLPVLVSALISAWPRPIPLEFSCRHDVKAPSDSTLNIPAIDLLNVVSGANVKSPAPTAPIAMNMTIVVVTVVAILPRKIFLLLVFKRCQSSNWW
jgi:hypothetical protein